MLRITLTVLLLSYPSRPAITRLGWGWRTARPMTGVQTALHGHMTSRSASTLPLLPWKSCHEASITPRADLCNATGRLTASQSRYAHSLRPWAPPHVAEVWRGRMQHLVLMERTTIMV
jgi:hypothetical protein